MAFQTPGYKLPGHVAGVDLRQNQFYIGEVSGDLEIGVADANTDFPIGVIQNDPNIGEAVEVMVTGVTKVVTRDDTISPGDLLTWNSDGRVEAIGADADEMVIGIALSDTPGATITQDVLIPMALIPMGEFDNTPEG